MKTLIGSLIALGLLAGVANATPASQLQNETVAEWGCSYRGH